MSGDQMARCLWCKKWALVRYCWTMQTWSWLYSGEYCPHCGALTDVNELKRRPAIFTVDNREGP